MKFVPKKVLVWLKAREIARREGFYMSPSEEGWPPLSVYNANPGNIKHWVGKDGRPYPTNGGSVDFFAWAEQQYPTLPTDAKTQLALQEGWTTLLTLLSDSLSSELDGSGEGGESR